MRHQTEILASDVTSAMYVLFEKWLEEIRP
jgi:hypothetical protein